MIRSISLTFWLCIAGAVLHAQDDGFLSAWNIFRQGNSIELAWTIAAGNTCEGTFISRSVNGSEPVPVFAIGGICGAPDRAESYRYSDNNTAENGRYSYFLEFGSVSAIRLEINFMALWPSGISVFTDTGGTTLIRVQFSGQPYAAEVFDCRGQLMYRIADVISDEFSLPSQAWSNGAYIVRIESSGGVMSDKFLLYR